MTTEFNVGDRVRALENGYNQPFALRQDLPAGTEGVVAFLWPGASYGINVLWAGHETAWPMASNEIERIEQ